MGHPWFALISSKPWPVAAIAARRGRISAERRRLRGIDQQRDRPRRAGLALDEPLARKRDDKPEGRRRRRNAGERDRAFKSLLDPRSDGVGELRYTKHKDDLLGTLIL